MAAFTGTARLARLALRRDRVQLPLWIVALVGLAAFSVASVVALYPGEEERVTLAIASAASPAALMTNGLVSGTSLGATVAAQMNLFLVVAVALMSTLAVVRHTRQNEETGRSELVGSAVVGRHAPLTAALAVTAGANVVIGLLSTAVLIANDLPVDGSVLTGAAIVGTGITFGAVAAVTAQVAETSRGANGLAAAAVGVAFIMRAVGDAAGEATDGGTRVISAWPSWLSPIGWAQQTRPYDLDVWWVLGLFVIATVALVATSFALTSHRDLGAGLRATPPGPPTAAESLLSPLGLAWRLHRGILLAWLIGMVVLGVTYGSVGDEVGDFLSGDQAADLIEQLGGEGDLVEAFFAATFVFGSVAAAGYAVQALLRMRSEEAGNRLEPVLAGAVGRLRWLGGHVVIAAVGAACLMAAMGLGAAVTYGLVVGDVGGQVGALAPAALAHIPAVLVVAGTTVAVFGLWPHRAVALAWGVYAVFLVIALFGTLLDLPRLLLDLSPFTHVPTAPVAEVTAAPLLGLLAAAAALGALGAWWFRRRDLSPG